MKHTVHTLLAALLITTLTVVTSFTLFNNLFFVPHDFTHAARMVEMQKSLSDGEFPVRWSRNYGFGYGMPLFNFYGPLPYYLAQPPLALGLNPIVSIKILYLLNGVLCGIGMYFLAREIWGKWSGLLSSGLFMLATYRAVDLFVRGALGEAFAFALLPFALYGVVRIVKGKRYGIPITALSLAAVLLSHNLTGMVSIGLVLLFGGILVLMQPTKKLQRSVLLGVGIVLAIGLSSFYTLPSFFEKSFTRVEQTITTGYFDYHNHFLCWSQLLHSPWGYGGSVPGCQDGMSFALGVIPLIVMVGAIAAILFKGSKKQRQLALVLTVLFVGSAFMTIGKSSTIWDHISVLKFFQFPWRWLTFVHVLLAVLAGGVLVVFRSDRAKRLACGVILIAVLLTQFSFFHPEKLQDVGRLNQYYSTTVEQLRSIQSANLTDYLPPGVVDDQFPNPTNDRVLSTQAGSTVHVELDRSIEERAQVFCVSDCGVEVHIFQFPGWSATVDGYHATLDPSGQSYSLQIPAGKHEVHIWLANTPIRSIGNAITLVSLVFLGIISIMKLHAYER